MFAKHVVGHSGEKSLIGEDIDWEEMGKEKEEESEEEVDPLTGRCFITTTSKSPTTKKVRNLRVSLNVPLNSYHSILSNFDDTCSC